MNTEIKVNQKLITKAILDIENIDFEPAFPERYQLS